MGSSFGCDAANAEAPQPVTVDNFVRAESDIYFASILKDSGGQNSALYSAAAPPGSTVRRVRSSCSSTAWESRQALYFLRWL